MLTGLWIGAGFAHRASVTFETLPLLTCLKLLSQSGVMVNHQQQRRIDADKAFIRAKVDGLGVHIRQWNHGLYLCSRHHWVDSLIRGIGPDSNRLHTG